MHFITSNWELIFYCLDATAIYEDHTGQNIADAVLYISENWKLSTSNLVAITTDNGSNMIAAFNTSLLVRISCFGHNLDLEINKGLQNTQVQCAID